jgi:sec-independent protein translocase protein TatC
MSLGEHLKEFRKRLYFAAIGIVVGGVGGWLTADFILDALRRPIYAVAESQGRVATLNYDGVTSAFDLKLQIALTVGIVVSSPVWLYQIWAFFVPAMTRREVKYVLGFFLSAIPLFLAGCYAGWLVFPRIVMLLTSFAPTDDSSIITAKSYFDFVLKLVIVLGVAFVLPVFLVLLNFAGVLSAKSILKSWRVAVLLIALFTAIATPTADVLSMLLLAAPMVVLYFVAVGVALIHDRRKERALAQADKQYLTPVAAETMTPPHG